MEWVKGLGSLVNNIWWSLGLGYISFISSQSALSSYTQNPLTEQSHCLGGNARLCLGFPHVRGKCETVLNMINFCLLTTSWHILKASLYLLQNPNSGLPSWLHLVFQSVSLCCNGRGPGFVQQVEEMARPSWYQSMLTIIHGPKP